MKKGYSKTIICIILVYAVVALILPMVFRFTIFENTALSNGELAGALGSYLGGILGGLGTLIAVYITVNNSNEYISKELSENRKQERQALVNTVAKELGIYITYISNYHYAGLVSDKLHENIVEAPRDLRKNTDHRDRLRRIYEKNSEFGNRLLANESFFTMKTMLCQIEQARTFLDRLAKVHGEAGLKHDGNWIGDETDRLIEEYNKFKEGYVL